MYFIPVLLYLIMSSNIVLGHPIKEHEGNKLHLKDEKKYSNGTVVGKYTYKDKDGNPIHVKYYADDSSYGVELKSVKVFGSHPELLKDKPNYDISPDAFGSFDVLNTANKILKNKSYNPYEVLNGFKKENRYKVNKKNDDYEIFLENNFKPTKKCDKEKVRIYSDKTRRKIRDLANNNNNKNDICERF